jgi:H/ACA ribonucleoprotein complex subunit 4
MSGARRELPGDQVRKRRTRATAPTNPAWGKNPSERTIEERIAYGVINLDKPSGPTSHQVAAWVRDIFGTDKVGHGGTLDPRVTGVLPTALNHATRGVSALLEAGKEYYCVMRMHGDAPEGRVREAAAEIVGKVKQLPPVRSAVARRVRTRRIYYLEILEVKGRDVLFVVGCEAGTYIRNVCIDLGKRIGVRAHMQQLRRSRTGPLDIHGAVTLQDVRDAWTDYKENGDATALDKILMPHEALFTHLPKIVVRDSAIGAVCHGAPLHLPGVVAVDDGIEPGDQVLIESLKGEAVAFGVANLDSKGLLEQEQGVAIKPDRVLMPKGTYPKVWKRNES